MDNPLKASPNAPNSLEHIPAEAVASVAYRLYTEEIYPLTDETQAEIAAEHGADIAGPKTGNLITSFNERHQAQLAAETTPLAPPEANPDQAANANVMPLRAEDIRAGIDDIFKEAA